MIEERPTVGEAKADCKADNAGFDSGGVGLRVLAAAPPEEKTGGGTTPTTVDEEEPVGRVSL